jgi:nitrous oxidase accessory protein NosD
MPTPRRHAKLLKFVPALVLIALALPTSAFGVTSRSWVSGTGDDANPCSRTKPCKTFAGALPHTAAGGVIGCLDRGGYSPVVISKSITIKCSDTDGGILAAGTNAIVIDAATTDKVTLRGLDINGAGTGAQTALVGIKVLHAASVHVLDSEISRFKTGVYVGGSSSTTRAIVANTHIHDNGIGVFAGPRSNTVDAVLTTLHDDLIADNGCGVVTSSAGASTNTPDVGVSECGSAAAPGHNRTTITSIFGNGIYDNAEGVHVRGQNASALVAYSQIAGNSLFGMHTLDSGILQTFTPATNVIVNNAATDPPNSVIAQTKRQAKRNRGR